MEIYHPHTKVDTMQVVHRFAELHMLVRELCHTFKVRVLTHNRKSFTEVEEYLANKTEATDEYKHHRLSRNARIMLVYPSGVPFGVAFLTDVNNKGNEELGYAFMAPFTAKNRGRGEDRYARKSTNIQALIKTIKKEGPPHEGAALRSIYMQNLYSNIQDSVRTEAKIPWRNPDVGRDTLVALLDFYLHNKMITDESSLKEINKAKALDDEIKTKNNECEEMLNRYKTDMHIVTRFTQSPILTVARLTYNTTREDYEVVHDSLKCYSSVDEMPSDLMLTYKMWRTKHETKMKFKPDQFFPSVNGGEYCSDFDVFINSHTFNAFGPLNHLRYFVTPIMSQANGN